MKAGRHHQGFSLTEVIVSIAVAGILAAIAAGSYGRIFERSRVTVAQHLVETLNEAVNRYVQIEGTGIREIAGADETFTEELAILRALQYDDPSDPQPGAPYMRADYNPAGSASSADFRAVWNGSYFELREPGAGGAGLLIRFDAADQGTPVVFAEGFTPLEGY